MDRPEVVALTPDDDKFHPPSPHPYETETFWVSFHHPERRLGGWFYNQVLFNQRTCNGGAWVWDDSPAGALYEVNRRDLPITDPEHLDLRDVTLPNGNHIEMLVPLTSYRVRRHTRRSPTRGTSADETIRAGVTPIIRGDSTTTVGPA